MGVGMAVKAAKKLAKKTTRKTVPKIRRMSVEELAAVMAENHAKTEAAIAKTEASIESAIERMSGEIRQLSIENQKTSAEVRKVTKNLDDSFGGISRRLGRLTELIVVPKIRRDMNAQGHCFDSTEVDKLIRGVIGGRKEDIAEVDMLLCGPTEAMAVEIKTRLKESSVKDHVERLQDLREHEEDADIKGKKLFGAVVGIIVDNTARELAKKNGLYVVEIREEENKLKIDKPENCRVW